MNVVKTLMLQLLLVTFLAALALGSEGNTLCLRELVLELVEPIGSQPREEGDTNENYEIVNVFLPHQSHQKKLLPLWELTVETICYRTLLDVILYLSTLKLCNLRRILQHAHEALPRLMRMRCGIGSFPTAQQTECRASRQV